MRYFFRYCAGALVGLLFVIIGARKRALACYEKEGAVLSIFAHGPTPVVFRRLVTWLIKQHFEFISADELLAIRTGKKRWRPRLVWLSLDDGLLEIDALMRILEEYYVPVTVFVAPAEIKRRRIWSATVARLVSPQKRRELFSWPVAQRYSYVDSLVGVAELAEQLMSESALIQMARHPLVTIENHTNSHMGCSFQSVEAMQSDIAAASASIFKMTKRNPRLMCYPYGFRTELHDAAVRKLGLIPVASSPGIMGCCDDLYCRNMFVDTMSNLENTCRVLGAWLKIGQMK